jgi:hypothetical protein
MTGGHWWCANTILVKDTQTTVTQKIVPCAWIQHGATLQLFTTATSPYRIPELPLLTCESPSKFASPSINQKPRARPSPWPRPRRNRDSRFQRQQHAETEANRWLPRNLDEVASIKRLLTKLASNIA